jgi:ACR3 family arsenite efflux pump ArsB
MNFIVVPVVVFGLTRFLPQEPAILVGVFMVLLTPCIDYVITFTELGGGDSEQITAATPALMLIQLVMLPLYLWLFMGQQVAAFIEAGPFIEAFVVIIAIPLSLAWATEYWAERAASGEKWQSAMGWLPVPMMGVTLFVIIGSQLPRVQDSIGQIAVVIPVYLAFLVIMPILGRLAADFLGMEAGESRSLVFTSVTRNSLVVLPLALALPSGYALAPVVVVTQTLIELSGMVVLTRVVPSKLVPDSANESLRLDGVQGN